MTRRTTIDRLIINSPYEQRTRHWHSDRQTRTFDLVEGRRPRAMWWTRAVRGPSTTRVSSWKSR